MRIRTIKWIGIVMAMSCLFSACASSGNKSTVSDTNGSGTGTVDSSLTGSQTGSGTASMVTSTSSDPVSNADSSLTGSQTGSGTASMVTSTSSDPVSNAGSTKKTEKTDDKIRKYVTLVFTNKRHEQVESYLSEMKYLYGDIKPDSDRMYAFGVIGPMLLTQSIKEMSDQVNSCFDYAEQYNIPVYFQLDDCNNYTSIFGSGAPVKFYQDSAMSEWVAFPQSGESYGGQKAYGNLPKFWYNWGTWRCAQAFPNFASSSLRKMVTNNLKQGVLTPLMKRYNKLVAEGKGYLFAGLAVGWETHIPDYSSNNSVIGLDSASLPVDPNTGTKMQPWELAQYGYGALHSLGYTQDKLNAEASQKGVSSSERAREILYEVIHDYSELLSKTAFEAGIPRHKIFTHMISLASSTNKPSTFSPPIWCAVNDYSIPGYTMSPVTCKYNMTVLKREILKADPKMSNFACAEGYAAGLNEESKAISYFKDMFGNGALNVTAFGYGDPPTPNFTFERTPDFGYNKALVKWLNHKF